MRNSIWFLYHVEEPLRKDPAEVYIRLSGIGQKFSSISEEISVVLLEVEDFEKNSSEEILGKIEKACREIGKQLMGRFIKMRPPIINPNVINPNE